MPASSAYKIPHTALRTHANGSSFSVPTTPASPSLTKPRTMSSSSLKRTSMTCNAAAKNRVGSSVVRQARTPTDHGLVLVGIGRAAMINRDVRARKQASPHTQLRPSITAPAAGCMHSKTEEEGDKASTSGEETSRTNPARQILLSDRNRKCEEKFGVEAGQKGKRLEGSGNEYTCKGTGRLG